MDLPIFLPQSSPAVNASKGFIPLIIFIYHVFLAIILSGMIQLTKELVLGKKMLYELIFNFQSSIVEQTCEFFDIGKQA